ncbi:MAG: 6-bladed beta-propeller [Rikenellaceae bacterium]
MKRAYTYIAATILLLVTSCGRRSLINDELGSLSPLQSQEITTDEVPNIIKRSRSIKLADDVIISQVRKVLIAPNKDFIIRDKSGVYQFSKDGDYIRTIGSRGRSRREYLYLGDICVDYTTNTLLILDEGAPKVLFYSHQRWSVSRELNDRRGRGWHTIASRWYSHWKGWWFLCRFV